MHPLPESPALDRLRRRSTWTLVAGVALGSTGHIAAVTVATIAAQDLAGSSAWAGIPGAAVVLGAAAGAPTLSALMVRSGRRTGLVTGYTVGIVGALLAVLALVARAFPLLLLGTVLIGFANSANNLSRYAAADLVPAARRASALGLVVWGATVGAVVGPNLVSAAGTAAEAIGLPRLAGAYLLPAVFVAGAALLSFALLRPDPYELADPSARHDEADGEGDPIRALLRRPTVWVSVVALVAVQVTMVLVMTMTPLHMTSHGHDLAAVGLVISAHTFGMYALSPLSGRLADRFGSPVVIVAGLLVTGGAAVLSALAPPDGGVLLALALFLLGFGWSLGFVAGSAMVTGGLTLLERTRLQGWTDALIWSSAAVASLGSGVLIATAGFAALGLLGAALVVIPAWIVLARRGHLVAVEEPGS
jgi:predicted MFS family arabinose efflux permease